MSNEQPNKHNPINDLVYIPLENISANDYNPNSVATKEMELLYISIKADGYTQPVVCVESGKEGHYTIVDGFHRFSVMKRYKDIFELNGGLLPCVVLRNKSINDRMASTIRHNRARGKHSMDGMGNIVVEMLNNGIKDDEVCNAIGLEAEELLRLKHITGYAKLYENHEYSKPVKTLKQIEERIRFEKGNARIRKENKANGKSVQGVESDSNEKANGDKAVCEEPKGE